MGDFRSEKLFPPGHLPTLSLLAVIRRNASAQVHHVEIESGKSLQSERIMQYGMQKVLIEAPDMLPSFLPSLIPWLVRDFGSGPSITGLCNLRFHPGR